MAQENRDKRPEVLRHLARGETRGWASPSVREVGAAVGLSSKQAAHKHPKKLEGHGYVERLRGAASRGLGGAAPSDAEGVRAVGVAAWAHGRGPRPRGGAQRGEGLLLGGGVDVFAFGQGKVAGGGRSRLEARIANGGIVVVEEDEARADGEAVGEEATLKRFCLEGRLRAAEVPGQGYDNAPVSARVVAVQGRVDDPHHPPRHP